MPSFQSNKIIKAINPEAFRRILKIQLGGFLLMEFILFLLFSINKKAFFPIDNFLLQKNSLKLSLRLTES